MSASMLSRQRKRRWDTTLRYAHDYLYRDRLPRGLLAELREWRDTWTEEEIGVGPDISELKAILDRYQLPWTGA